MRGVTILLASALCVMAMSALVVVNLAFGDDGDESKAAYLALEKQRDDAAAERAAELEAAGQEPAIEIPTVPASCPGPLPQHLGVQDWLGRGTPPKHIIVSNLATLIGETTYSNVWAGYGVADGGENVGVLELDSFYIDPCVVPGYPKLAKIVGFSFDEQEGAITVTAAEGNVVEFESASGKRGSINTDTGELTVPDDFQPLPVPTAPALEVTPVPAN